MEGIRYFQRYGRHVVRRRESGAETVLRRGLIAGLLLLGSTAVAVIGAELAVRWVFRDLTTTSPIDSYFGVRWKQRHLEHNRWGFREREFALEKPAGVYRIAVVGDSFAVAMGLPVEQRFTNRVERALNREGGRFEVLQFANPGAETHHQLKTLRDFVLPARPDFVLLQWYVNDFEYTKTGRPEPPGDLIAAPELHDRLYRSSALYILVNHAWRSLQLSWGRVVRFEDYMRERFGDPESADSRTAMRILETFVTRCQEAGVPVGIVLFPRPTERLAHYPLAFLHRRVLAMCEARAIPCLDLTPAFVPYADRIQEIWLNRFDHHPGALGHRLAAERILAEFRPYWRRDG
jgi:hypothetical protein